MARRPKIAVRINSGNRQEAGTGGAQAASAEAWPRLIPLLFIILALIWIWPPEAAEAVRPERPERPTAKSRSGLKSSNEREQLLRAIYPRAPQSLDPHDPPDPAAWPVIMASYHRLMSFGQGMAKPVPSLAKSVAVSPDGLKYTFYLNEGLTFADGTVLNSEAALYSFNRLMLSEVGRRYYPYLSRFEIVGPYTFRLILSRPWPPFLASLALPQASLVSPDLANRPGDYLKQRTLGSGPYQVYDWKDDTIGLQIRPDQTAAPAISFVMFHYEPDPQKRLAKALAHQAHLTIEPAPSEEALPAQFQLKKVPTYSIRYLAFNTSRPYTGMQNVRRALSTIVNSIFADYPGHLQGPFPTGFFYNEPSSPAPPVLTDPLAQAGYVLNDIQPPAVPLTLIYPDEGDPSLAAEAALIADTLDIYGLRVKLVGLKGADGRRILEAGDYDFYLGTRSPDIPSPDMWLGRFLDSSSTVDGNPAFFRHLRADRLIAEIVNTVGKPMDGPSEYRQLEADRAAKVAELAELARTEAPYAFLYQLEKTLLLDARLAHLSPHPIWPEVWPIDVSSLKPFSFKSGSNPTGRPPGQTAESGPAPRPGQSITVPRAPLAPQAPSVIKMEPESPTSPALADPPAPQVPGVIKMEPESPTSPSLSGPPAPPAPTIIQLEPEVVETAPQPAPSPAAEPEQVLDYFDLEQLDDPAPVPPNPNPDYDDFLGLDMNEGN